MAQAPQGKGETMRYKLLFSLAFLGILAGCVAGLSLQHRKTGAATGIQSRFESLRQGHLCRRNCRKRSVQRREHQRLSGSSRHGEKFWSPKARKCARATPLLLIDDSIQRPPPNSRNPAAEAALRMLEELKAEPRKETLDVAEAQVVAAKPRSRPPRCAGQAESRLRDRPQVGQ